MEIDGSQKSGSGTILRLAVALAAILGESIHVYRIRAKRPNPGLRPQHLEAVRTAAKLCNAKVDGDSVSSREIWFTPGRIRGGEIHARIGTAGSISMLMMTVLPICVFAERETVIHVSRGGTDVRNAPTINYLRMVVLPVLRKMGVEAEITVHRYGYYPKGHGEATLRVRPRRRLLPIWLDEFGELERVRGISVCTLLKDRRVADRQADAARKVLKRRGIDADIEVVYDESNPIQPGSSIVLWAETSTGVLLGADAIGEVGKPSERVGREAAEALLRELDSRATADVHMADILVPYVAMADGPCLYLTREMTEHLETNIWLTETILNARFSVSKVDGLYRIEKLGSGPWT